MRDKPRVRQRPNVLGGFAGADFAPSAGFAANAVAGFSAGFATCFVAAAAGREAPRPAEDVVRNSAKSA